MIEHKSRDYDLELSKLLKQFEPYNLLTGDRNEPNLFEINQPVITATWVDNTTEYRESKNANS
jgi:hypothetical protein